MFCEKCGMEMQGNVCECGNVKQQVVNQVENNTNVNDAGGIGWWLLGFFVPIVGLVLYLVWKEEKPKSSKAAGQGALVHVILSIVGTILYFAFIIMLAMGIFGAAMM